MPWAFNDPNPQLDPVRYELRANHLKHSRSPLRGGIHSRGYLPHIKREGASYFVTFHLADALPKEALLRFERDQAERRRLLAGSGMMMRRRESATTFSSIPSQHVSALGPKTGSGAVPGLAGVLQTLPSSESSVRRLGSLRYGRLGGLRYFCGNCQYSR